MSRIVRKSVFTALTIAAGAVLLVQACVSSPKPKTTAVASRPECPHDWDSVSLQRVEIRSGAKSAEGGSGTTGPVAKFSDDGQLFLAGLISSVPEFHDCQKFIVQVGGAEVYTGLMAIFARFKLDSVYRNDTAALHSTGIWVAEIAAESDYEPLDIKYGFNCLAIRDSSGSRQALMVNNNTVEECDSLTADMWTRRPRLLVTANVPNHGEIVPPVARWDWDSLHGRQFLGVQCGTAWCEVYSRDGYDPSPQHAVAASFPGGRDVVNVKGWYDSQRLARQENPADMSPNPKLIPTAGRSNVYPVAGLGGREKTDYQNFLPAAYVTMNYEGKYDKGMGLRAMSDPPVPDNMRNPAATNLISLCLGTNCGVAAATQTDCGKEMGLPPESLWFARTKGATGWREFCVHYREYPKDVNGKQPYTVPGVVRWRWKAKDETVWISCPSGCCEVVVDDQ